MNTLQIEQIFKNKYSNTFKGAIAFDELPTKISRPSAYIINTHSRDKSGEHWLGIYFNTNNSVDFFDSFGMGPQFYRLENYLFKYNSTINYNKYALQSLNSNYCGLYCVLFIIFKCKRKSFYNFLDIFKTDTLINDYEIKKLIDFYK
jgi:hypothetical protein